VVREGMAEVPEEATVQPQAQAQPEVQPEMRPEVQTIRQVLTLPVVAKADGGVAGAGPEGTTAGLGTAVTALIKEAAAEIALSEPVPNIHPEAGGDVADDARRYCSWFRSIPAVARIGIASG